MTHDYDIDCSSPDRARISGVLRLSSPADYEEALGPVRAAMQAHEGGYTVDVSRVKFLNSSGITGLSRLVLLARTLERPMTLIGSESTPWQTKTLTLLTRLYSGLDVQLV